MFTLLQNKEIKRKGVIFPRYHAKSTICTFLLPVHRIAYSPMDEKEYIIIISETQEQSINFLSSIKLAIEENEVFRYYFGDLKGPVWREDEIITSNGVRIKAIGTRQRIRGTNYLTKRPTLIILDDFESELNSWTEESRNRNKDWISGAVEPSLDKTGEMVVTGTIVHPDAFLPTVQDDPEFDTMFHKAIENGKPIWPQYYDLAYFEKKRRSYEARGQLHVYYMEYFNEPINPEDLTFKQEDFQHWEGQFVVLEGRTYAEITHLHGSALPELEFRPINIYIGVDPSISGRGDFSAMVPIGVDHEGFIFIGDYVQFKGQADRIVDEVFRMFFRYRPVFFCIETIAFQKLIALWIRKRMVATNTWIPLKEIPSRHGEEKMQRIQGMQPFFSAKKVFLKNRHDEIKAQLMAVPKPKKDDLIDALENAVSEAQSAAYATRDDIERMISSEPEFLDWMVL